jgi:hypothetical protein
LTALKFTLDRKRILIGMRFLFTLCALLASGCLLVPAGAVITELEVLEPLQDLQHNKERSAQKEHWKQEQRRRAEEKRAAEAAAEEERRNAKEIAAQQAKALEQVEESTEAMQLVWSAVICRWTMIRGDAKDEIATENTYAAEGGGIVSMSRLYSLHENMRTADERIAHAKSKLTEIGAEPLSCKDKKTLPLILCITLDSTRVSYTVQDLERLAIVNCNSTTGAPLRDAAYRADPVLQRMRR